MTDRSTDPVSHPKDSCERCHGSNVVWFAPSEIWNVVHGDFDILCPVCFVTLAERSGISATAWKIAPEDLTERGEIIRLRTALAEFESMYARTWDRVDGALVMMPDSIPRFEAAHKKARAALGVPLVDPDEPPVTYTAGQKMWWKGGGYGYEKRIPVTVDSIRGVKVRIRFVPLNSLGQPRTEEYRCVYRHRLESRDE